MKVLSTKIPEELFNAVQEFAEQKVISVSKLVAQALQAVIQGKIEMKPLGGRDICPHCAHTVHILQQDINHGAKIWFVCLNCDWAGYIGKFTLPKEVDNLTNKFIKKI